MIVMSIPCIAQPGMGVLKGRVIDGSTFRTLYGVNVVADSAAKGAISAADGGYSLGLLPGMHSVCFRAEGFQSKVVSGVNIRKNDINYLTIVLFPRSSLSSFRAGGGRDSVPYGDSLVRSSLWQEGRRWYYNPVFLSGSSSDLIPEKSIQPGTDPDGAQLLQRLNGVIVGNKAGSADLYSLNIYGLGARYNQVLFNEALQNSSDPLSQAWRLDFFPVELIEAVTVQRTGDVSRPAGFAGGSVAIRTKDIPDQNFFYIRAGGGFSDGSSGKQFFSDKRGSWDWAGFPGSTRDLPGAFPTTRSPSSLDQKNPQEQVYLSKLLKNNLAPVSQGATRPDDRVLLGFGRKIRLKKGETIGVLAFVNHQGSERIDAATVQAAPDPNANPYFFPNSDKPLIRSLANDIHYRYASRFGATLNASILFGKNKISWKNFFSSSLSGAYTRRSQLFKPDEDSLAHTGINYHTEQAMFLQTQLSGEHAFGGDGKFKMNWLASYAYDRRQNPDDRNFLLRQDSSDAGRFEIAHPQTPFILNSVPTHDPAFTNSGRTWTDSREHDFTGSVGIGVPFNLFNQSQVLSGGISIYTRYRVLHSDLLLTNGGGYGALNALLGADRYFPGGLTATNYYINYKSLFGGGNSAYIDPTVRGNYVASSNLGAAYIKLDNHITDHLSLNWGLRLESNSQLVSSVVYPYAAGFRNPQTSTIDENANALKTDLLPSAELVYRPLAGIQLHAAAFTTVNRPQLQELSLYRQYDALSFLVTTGNQLLSNTIIDNYDLGVDWVPYAGSRISVSGFYKKMDQPIEHILSVYSNAEGNLSSVPYNTAPATIKGLTAAFRTDLGFIDQGGWLSGISLFANGNWLNSKVKAGPVRGFSDPSIGEHSLSGSPDYTVNAGLVVQVPGAPMLTVLYDLTGDYISALGSGASFKLENARSVTAIPDYRVKGREQLDLRIAQKFFGSRLQVIAGVNNLSNSAYVEYQDLNGNKKFDQPLNLTVKNNSGGYFNSGTDNTVLSIKAQRTYHFTLTYLFK